MRYLLRRLRESLFSCWSGARHGFITSPLCAIKFLDKLGRLSSVPVSVDLIVRCLAKGKEGRGGGAVNMKLYPITLDASRT